MPRREQGKNPGSRIQNPEEGAGLTRLSADRIQRMTNARKCQGGSEKDTGRLFRGLCGSSPES